MVRRYVTGADVKRMRALYEDGWSIARIGHEVGFTDVCVWQHLKRVGVEFRGPKGARTPQRDARLIRAYLAGTSMSDLCERFGLSVEGIYGVIRRRGFKPNRKSPRGYAVSIRGGQRSAQKRWGMKTRKEAA